MSKTFEAKEDILVEAEKFLEPIKKVPSWFDNKEQNSGLPEGYHSWEL